jgi:hypothetical protein
MVGVYDRVAVRFARLGFALAMVATLVVFLNAGLDVLFPHGWQGPLKLAAGGVLAAEGSLLATNWLGARSRLVQRWLASHTGGQSVAAAAFRRFLEWTLKTIGFVWLVVGVLEIVRGATA